MSAPVLEHEVRVPEGAREGAPLVVLLHGRGADRFDLLALAPLVDPAIPFAFAVEGRAALAAAGAEMETRDYPIAHAISSAEAEDVRAWIERGAGARAP